MIQVVCISDDLAFLEALLDAAAPLIGESIESHAIRQADNLSRAWANISPDLILFDMSTLPDNLSNSLGSIAKAYPRATVLAVTGQTTSNPDRMTKVPDNLEVLSPGDEQQTITLISRKLLQIASRHETQRWVSWAHRFERDYFALLDVARRPAVLTRDELIIYSNDRFRELLGYDTSESALGQRFAQRLTSDSVTALAELVAKLSIDDDTPRPIELNIVASGSVVRDCDADVSSCMFQDSPCTKILLSEELSVVSFTQKLRDMRNFDPATGLPNLSRFKEHLGRFSARAQSSGVAGVVAVIEIERFEEIQSIVGTGHVHKAVVHVAKLVKSELDSRHALARYDEARIGVLIPQCDVSVAVILLEAAIKKVEASLFETREHSMALTVAIGLTVINHANSETASLMEQVEAAEPEELSFASLMQPFGQSRAALLFQAIVSLKGEVRPTYEVLLSVTRASGEAFATEEVFRLLAESGDAVRVHRWVVEQAVATVERMRYEGLAVQFLVKLTAQTLLDKTNLETLMTVISNADLPRGALTFEVPRSMMFGRLRQIKKAISILHKRGCHAALSQFGQSSSELASLTHIHTDYLMLHPSVLHRIGQSADAEERINKLRDFADKKDRC